MPRIWVIALVWVVGCECGRPLVHTAPDPRLVPAGDGETVNVDSTTLTIDFGTVDIGTASTREVRIHNEGTAPVAVERVIPAAVFNAASFDVPTAGPTIEPGGTVELAVAFHPLDTSSHQAVFEILMGSSGEGPSSLEVVLTGNGASSGCTLSPSSALDFGNVLVGTEETLDVSVRNSGTRSLTLESVQLLANAGGSFLQDGGWPVVSPGGATAELPVTFAPTQVGDAAAVLALTSSTPCQPTSSIALRGTGVSSLIVAEPNPLDFGFVDVSFQWGQVVRTVTLTNIGQRDVSLPMAQLCGGGTGCVRPGEFALSSDGQSASLSAFTLAAGSSVDVPVYFRPTSLTSTSAELRWPSNGIDPPVIVAITGSGGGPRISVQPSALTFPLTATGYSKARQLIVSNIGTTVSGEPASLLDVTAIEVLPSVGTAAGEFTVQLSPPGSPPFLLARGEDRVVEIDFAPSSDGTKEAIVRFHSNDPAELAVDVRVSGTAKTFGSCTYVVTPAQVDFGAIVATSTRFVTIQNTGTHPQDECLISDLSLTPTTWSGFTLPDGPIASRVIPVGAALDVPVALAAVGSQEQAATFTGELTFDVSSAGSSTVTVPLSGEEGCVQVAPAPLDFGAVVLGCKLQRSAQILSRCTSTPVTVTAVSVGLDAGVGPTFLVDAGLAGGIVDGGVFAVPVTFQPAFVGADFGALEIEVLQGSTSLKFSLPLTGEGVATSAVTEHFIQSVPRVDVILNRFRATGEGLDPDGGNTVYQLTQTFLAARDAGVDFKVAAIYTDYAIAPDPNPMFGRFIPNDAGVPVVITNASADISGGIRDLWSYPGTAGAFYNHAYEGFLEAFTPPLVGNEPAASFLRPDASLAFVLMAAEYDDSPASSSYYYSQLANLKGQQHLDLLTMNVASYLSDYSCLSHGPSYGLDRYTDLLTWTGGAGTELCDPNWAQNFEPLRAALFTPKSRFSLANVPVASSITVSIDGGLVASSAPDGGTVWVYEPTQNWVRFSLDAVPPLGSSIDISYQLVCQ